MEGAIFQLLAFAEGNPRHWMTLVGLFWQQTEVSPTVIDGKVWEKDGRLQDMQEKGRSAVEGWSLPADSPLIHGLALQINNGMLEPFLEAVRRWTRGPTGDFEAIAKKAGWVHSYIAVHPQAWQAMSELKAMDEGDEKLKKLAQAKAESPRFFERCMKDGFCGT